MALFSASELGVGLGAGLDPVSDTSISAKYASGLLRIATGGDQGADRTVELQIKETGQADRKISLKIITTRPLAVETMSEPAPALTVTGLGSGNKLGGAPLTFNVAGAPPLDPANSTIVLVDVDNGRANLTASAIYTASSNTLSVPQPALTTALASLKPGPIEIQFNPTSNVYAFSQVYTLYGYRAQASISGSVVNSGGLLVTALANRQVALVGRTTDARIVATIGADGKFAVSDVMPDTYDVSLVDLDWPNYNSATAVVFPTDTLVNFSLTYTSPPAVGTSGFLPASDSQQAVKKMQVLEKAGSFQGNSFAVAPRAVSAGLAPQALDTACTSVGGTTYTYTAIAGVQNVTTKCGVEYTVAKGSTFVNVAVRVTTAEYPVYTTQKSKYDDTWMYAIQIPIPGEKPLEANNSVNNSHYTTGQIDRSKCYDFTSIAANAPLTITGTLNATNIGDSALATVVRTTISPGCGAGLRVERADFGPPNGAGAIVNTQNYAVVKRLDEKGKRDKPYLSLPSSADASKYNKWGVPLRIAYAPKDAEITGFKFSVISGGTSIATSGNLLGTSNALNATVANGVITIPNFIIPINDGYPQTDQILGLSIQLSGKINGVAADSPPNEANIYVGYDTGIRPLYQLEPLLAPSRLYSRNDPQPAEAGGDTWATKSAMTWLFAKTYVVNDITGLHVPQTLSGQSALGHTKGHNNGRQLDLRYYDGAGGFTDPLNGQTLNGVGGQAIFQLALDAAAEQAANTPPANQTKIPLLRSWILQNRQMIETELAGANAEKIVVGGPWMEVLLQKGKFFSVGTLNGATAYPVGVDIPLVGTWNRQTNPTSKLATAVFFDPGHNHHWHMQLLD